MATVPTTTTRVATVAGELPPALVAKAQELASFADVKQKRFLQLGKLENVTGELCPRCVDDERLDLDIRENYFANHALKMHQRSLFHSPQYRLLRYLVQEFPERVQFPKAFTIPGFKKRDEGSKKLSCPFCTNHGRLRTMDVFMEHLAKHKTKLDEDLWDGLYIQGDPGNQEMEKTADYRQKYREGDHKVDPHVESIYVDMASEAVSPHALAVLLEDLRIESEERAEGHRMIRLTDKEILENAIYSPVSSISSLEVSDSEWSTASNNSNSDKD
ncbi:hypothetical protein NCC49_000692 [Naganishia albida]|nr:hypothetical protein NCC49_000692 [Naganishia albida]